MNQFRSMTYAIFEIFAQNVFTLKYKIMEILTEKIDALSPFLHGTFKLDNSEFKNDNHLINCKMQHVNNHVVFTLTSKLIQNYNYYLFVQGKHLLVFITEIKRMEIINVHHPQKSAFNEPAYAELRTCEYTLPTGHYFITQARLNGEKGELKISLYKKIWQGVKQYL